ncbi:MAG: C2 family cysteine protease [Methylobacterium frigidaeris]
MTPTITNLSNPASVQADPFALLTDAGVHDDVCRLIRGDSLDYGAMETILQDAAWGGISASEFDSLQALGGMLNAPDGIRTSDYVCSISRALIDGDPSNAHWTGGGVVAKDLGDLHTGSSQAQTDRLIDKWFHGRDEPSLSDVDGAGQYRPDDKPLFHDGGPVYADVNQGSLGDCYLMSSLAEVALRDTDTIRSMFTDNHNGTYGVRFFDSDGHADYVTVDDRVPMRAETWANNAHETFANGDVAWVALAEKAYVELNGGGGVLSDGLPRTAGNAYHLIKGGYADPITAITGKPVARCSPDLHEAVSALLHGQEVLMSTPENVHMPDLVEGHMFEVLGFDAKTDRFEIHNPWGANSDTKAATFWASASELTHEGVHMYAASGTALA